MALTPKMKEAILALGKLYGDTSAKAPTHIHLDVQLRTTRLLEQRGLLQQVGVTDDWDVKDIPRWRLTDTGKKQYARLQGKPSHVTEVLANVFQDV